MVSKHGWKTHELVGALAFSLERNDAGTDGTSYHCHLFNLSDGGFDRTSDGVICNTVVSYYYQV